jgi:hypothetical protein
MKNKELCVYDFDHTLVHTSSRIKLKETGEPLSHELYEKLVKDQALDHREIFDFSDYDIMKEPTPIESVLSKLKEDLEQGHDCFVLTARRNSKPVKDYLPTLLSGKSIPVVSVNADDFRFEGEGDHQRKASWIQDKLSNGNYSSLSFYEDSIKNANEVYLTSKNNLKIDLSISIVQDDKIMPLHRIINRKTI